MLKIENLQARIEEKEILKGINLTIKPGEVHAIMGPNGSGKSTLASVLAGRADYEVTGGSVDFLGKDLLELSPEDRAKEGLFLAFQYPVEIPGVSTTNFMKTALNEKRKYLGLDPLDAATVLEIDERKNEVGADRSILAISFTQRRIFWWREEEKRNFSNGHVGTKIGNIGRNRFWFGY